MVDLPGYGYAKVPLAVRDKWQRELELYLRKRQVLCGLILLSDIRHPLKEFDRLMIDWANQSDLPLHILLTKADKLKKRSRPKHFAYCPQGVKRFAECQRAAVFRPEENWCY